MAKAITYDQAIEELEQIVSAMENGGVMSVEAYTKQAKRAAELIDFCTKKLRQVDVELQQLFQDTH